MIRFLLRSLGSVLLAAAIVFAVADIARSIAADATRLTSFGQALGLLGVSTEPVAGQSQTAIDFLALVSAWPAAAVLAAAAFLLLFLGRTRRGRERRLAG